MLVRRLDADEWPALREVRLRALQQSPAAFASSYAEEADRPESWWVDGMTRLAWFVAEDDGQIVGLVAGMPLDGDRSEVISMWVDPAHRGTGIADGLLGAVVAWAEAEGATGLCLAVAEDNPRARHFYERAGFFPSGPGESLRSRPDVCTTEMRLELREAPAS